MFDWLYELGGNAADAIANGGEFGSAAGDLGDAGATWGGAAGDTAGAVAPAAGYWDGNAGDAIGSRGWEAATSGLESGGGGAALDAVNPAFTPQGSWTGYMPRSTGDLGTETVQPLNVHSVDPAQSDLGTASTLSRGSAVTTQMPSNGNVDELNGMNAQNSPAASPMSQFRQSVGAIPGKWWQSLTDAPKNAAEYVGNNPGKTLMAAGTLGMNVYRASQGQPGAPKSPLSTSPSPSFPSAAPPSAPSSPLVNVGETPRSPLLQGYNVKRSGGFNVGR